MDSSTSTRHRREHLRQQEALVASKIDALRASDRQIERSLKAINANVRGAQADLESTERALDQAKQDAALAQQGIETATAEIATLESSVQGLVLESYMNPLGDTMLAVLDSTNLSDAATKRALLGVVQQHDADVADELDRAREDLTTQRQLAEEAAALAAATREEIVARLDDLQAAKQQQLDFEDRVQDRLDAALSEAAALESQDNRLAAIIARDQAALAAQLRSRSGARGTALAPIGPVAVVSVRGILVNAQVADRLQAMLSSAAGDGIILSGGGYRNSSSQVALRRAHCGSSQYALYAMPAYQCRPPTARPGASMHERGLAIDFSHGGALISSRSSRAYKWLAAHASSYGFYNLPSEPWHWSTNGN